MPAELSTATLNGGSESVAGPYVLNLGDHCVHGADPHVGRRLGVYTTTGDDLSMVLGDGGKYQNSGALLGEVDAVRQNLMLRIDVLSYPDTIRYRTIGSDKTTATTMNQRVANWIR